MTLIFLPTWLEWAAGIGMAAAVAYLAVCIFLRLYQRHFIFYPSATIVTTPDMLSLRYETVWIPVTRDRIVERLHAWWLPTDGPRQGVVLHLHGNGHNIGANLAQAIQFQQLGWAVLMIDYRGYGQSEGAFPSEASVYADASAAWHYLTQQRGIAPRQIVLFGHSLGGAIAINLALRHPDAGGLIVQSSFTSMRAMVARSAFRLFPVDFVLTQRFDSLANVRSLQVPVLYVHGTADTVVPASMSDALWAASPEPKRLVLIPNADHNDVAAVGGERYRQVLQDFFAAIAQTPNSTRH